MLIKRTKICGGGVLLENMFYILLIVSARLKMEVQSTSNNGLHSSRVVALC